MERLVLCTVGCFWVLALGCEKPEEPPARIEVEADHRSCEEGDACGVVETSCTSRSCECGVAVNESHLLDYQKKLAECRGQRELATCDFQCSTPFGKCFKGACVLTSEPPELFQRGRSVQVLCESTRGTYVGCPKCPPNERCESCAPCECPASSRWGSKGCRAVVLTEAREIRVETRPSRVTFDDEIKARVTNDSRRKVWLRTVCKTPLYRLRKKQDEWETQYDAFRDVKCETGALEIAPGASRHFVVRNLDEIEGPSGGSLMPGTYRFELTYTDGNDSFQYHAPVYSPEFDLVPTVSRR